MNKNWIDDVIQELEHVETPRSWIWWSLACAVSAAMGNNYYLVAFRGAVIYKANLYVILMGESGLGKNFPIKLAKNLVNRADVTRVIFGRSSIQGILADLALQVTREHKGPILDSRAFIANGELATAIITDPDSITTLTDLYDGNDDWANKLKSGKERLVDPYITALFGSSPAHFYDKIPQVNIEGGYIGRNLVVSEEKRYKDNDMFDDDEVDLEGDHFKPFLKFVKHLEDISSFSGRMIPTPDAKALLNSWRKEWRAKQPLDKTGFINRVPDHVVKVAMVLAASEYINLKTLLITTDHISDAIEKVVPLAYTNKRTTEGKGSDPLSEQLRKVLDFLLKAPNNKMFRRELLRKGYGDYDGPVLDRILDQLYELKWIEKERYVAGRDSDIIISLCGEPLKQYREFVGRKRAQL